MVDNAFAFLYQWGIILELLSCHKRHHQAITHELIQKAFNGHYFVCNEGWSLYTCSSSIDKSGASFTPGSTPLACRLNQLWGATGEALRGSNPHGGGTIAFGYN